MFLSCLTDGCSADNYGTKYLVSFMESTATDPKLELFPATKRTNAVRVDAQTGLGASTTVSTFASYTNGLHQAILLPSALKPEGVVLDTAAVEVTADADIGLYGMYTDDESCDGFLALPVDALDTEYYVMSYDQGGSRLSEFVVMAEQAATLVTITLPEAGPQLRFTYNTVEYKSGDTFSVTLNSFEVFQVQSAGELSGTKILATKRVGVISGSVRSAVAPASVLNPVAGHMMETLLPTSSWGTNYFIVPVSDRSRSDIIKIVTYEDDTNIDMLITAQGK